MPEAARVGSTLLVFSRTGACGQPLAAFFSVFFSCFALVDTFGLLVFVGFS